ncbi:MAG: sigma-70 family RNA polymerase sigma factor [Patescibacteria group bacterium]
MEQNNIAEKEFIAAYDQFSKDILRHIYYRVNDNALAEEMLQETFLRTWQYLRKGKKVDSFKSLLYRVAGNMVIDHYRTKKPPSVDLEEAFNLPDEGNDRLEDKIDRDMDLKMIKKYLSELADDQRQMIIYKYLDQLSIKEIADITGKTMTNIYVIIHRGMKTLKNKVKEQYDQREKIKINARESSELSD